MKSTRTLMLAAYGLAAVAQVAVLAGAYELYAISRKRMMVMRYLVAKNRELEIFWFSPASVRVQLAVFGALAVASLVAALVFAVRRSRWLAVQCGIGAVLSAVGAWLLLSFSAEKMWSLHAVTAAVWVALVLQLVVVGVSLARSRG